jgi:hypothetical protein
VQANFPEDIVQRGLVVVDVLEGAAVVEESVGLGVLGGPKKRER